ncbi:MAG: glycoside hydrolase family 1 protein [Erysipelotrichaceae bacterium]|nr:glycoside hydrolase family 1 protein [Erysipelotrichaceae bacterium]
MSLTEKFLWGASTSAFQIEGAYNIDGKGLATTDVRHVPEGMADTKVACDHYHHWKEDVDLMAELGLNTYRMGFSWSRIMPDETLTPNPKGLSFYDQLIDYLLEKNIEPLVTLYHFECPQALVDAFGGWKSRKMIDAYVKYAEVCFRHFKDRVKKWVTVNEQFIATAAPDLAMGYIEDPYERSKWIYQISYHVSLAEHRAFSLLKEIDPEAYIGPVCSIQVVYPATSDPKDVAAAKEAEEMMEFILLDLSVYGEYSPFAKTWLKKRNLYPETKPEDAEILHSSKPDFIGVNYYFSTCAKYEEKPFGFDTSFFWAADDCRIVPNEHVQKTEWMNMGTDALGLYDGMRKIYERYHLPLIVTENGIAVSEKLDEEGKIHDDYRIAYLKDHIDQVLKLREEGYPVFGYCPWSFMDVLSSHQGFSKRYGLVFIDRTETDPKECARVRKDSFFWYQNVIRTGKTV